MRRAAPFLVPLALVLALVGCGGGDETAAPEAGSTESTESSVEDLANVLQLRSDFEADAGKTRAIVLLSPT